MKAKFLIGVLTGAMMFTLIGCGSSDSDETTEDTSSVAEETEDTSESASSEETEESDEAEESDEIEETADEEDASATEQSITFDSLTVVDNDECSIVITGIDPDGMWGYTLDLELENKSEDKTYMFAVQDTYANDVEVSGIFASEVAAGKKAIESMYFSTTTLEENGVGDITDIEISIHVYDSDDWSSDDVADETVHVYPYGEENAASFVRESQESDQVLVDDDNVTVIVIGYDADSIWGYAVDVYLVNKTDASAMFTVDDASVNGYMSDPFWATSVAGGKSSFASITWYDSSLEELGITDPENEIEEIEFVLKVYNYDDYTMDDYVNETVTLNP